jgi:Meiotically up-regulated gene 113
MSRGMIYFIRTGEYVKIGYSTNVPTRLSGIKTATPYDIELLGTCPGTRATEKSLHDRFARLHYRGEWFRFAALRSKRTKYDGVNN